MIQNVNKYFSTEKIRYDKRFCPYLKPKPLKI